MGGWVEMPNQLNEHVCYESLCVQYLPYRQPCHTVVWCVCVCVCVCVCQIAPDKHSGTVLVKRCRRWVRRHTHAHALTHTHSHARIHTRTHTHFLTHALVRYIVCMLSLSSHGTRCCVCGHAPQSPPSLIPRVRTSLFRYRSCARSCCCPSGSTPPCWPSSW